MSELVTNQTPNSTYKTQTQARLGDAPPAPAAALPSDRIVLGGIGAALLGLAGVFGWRELHLDPAYLLTLGAGGALVLSTLSKRRALSTTGLALTLACGGIGGAWYAATRTGALLPGIGLGLVASLLFLVLGYPRARAAGDERTVALGFSGLVVTALATTWSLYFRFLTSGVAAESVGRRLVLTLCWVAAGAVLVVLSGRRRELAMRYAGYVFVAAATLKTLFYDTTHLGGGLRVLVLLLTGAVLLGSALLSNKQAAAK